MKTIMRGLNGLSAVQVHMEVWNIVELVAITIIEVKNEI